MSVARTSKLKSELKIELNGIQRIFSLVGEQCLENACWQGAAGIKRDVKIVHL